MPARLPNLDKLLDSLEATEEELTFTWKGSPIKAKFIRPDPRPPSSLAATSSPAAASASPASPEAESPPARPRRPTAPSPSDLVVASVFLDGVITNTLKNMLELASETDYGVPFRFSEEQAVFLTNLFSVSRQTPDNTVQTLLPDTMRSLFSQKLFSDPFESPLLSALALLSVV
ncbi:hypothetical protein NW759_004866 [Fusarium solani]|nr:hypothetical protein NW759_004866 [Fusarium solani]